MKPVAGNRNPEACSRFEENGFEILADVLSAQTCEALATELSALYRREQAASGKKIAGIRNLLSQSPHVTTIAGNQLRDLVERLLGRSAFPVRALFFDKTPDANWRVPWHQDLTIAVTRRVDIAGFTGWSVKDDVVHVQPPRELLEGMVTIRLHLDDCDADNGPLKIIPRSHQHGKLNSSEIARWTERDSFTCEIPRGGVLLMRPLLLHASSPAVIPMHRRVLHIEYATTKLPDGLEWFQSI